MSENEDSQCRGAFSCMVTLGVLLVVYLVVLYVAC